VATTACAHSKWLGGHGGIALAVLDPELLTMPPPSPGWMGAPDPFAMDAQQLLLAPDARRYTQVQDPPSSFLPVSFRWSTVLINDSFELKTQTERRGFRLCSAVDDVLHLDGGSLRCA
jgi:hypothetical protein